MSLLSKTRLRELRHRLSYRARTPVRRLPLPGSSKDYRRFVIVTTGRSGSNLLIQRCESHPNAYCYGELFNPIKIHWHRVAGPEYPGLHDFRSKHPKAFLDAHAWHWHPSHIQAVGFKLIHAQYFAVAKTLKPFFDSAPDIHFIFLTRRNYLKVLLAAKRTLITGIHGIKREEDRPSVPPIHLPIEECFDHFRRTVVSEAVLRKTFANHPALELTYEDLVADADGENARLCGFLGLDNLPLTQKSIKLATKSLAEQIENYDELKTHFADSQWAPFFE